MQLLRILRPASFVNFFRGCRMDDSCWLWALLPSTSVEDSQNRLAEVVDEQPGFQRFGDICPKKKTLIIMIM